jgi:hypothetical protein
MLRREVRELWDAHTKMQQTVARMSDNAEELARAQQVNAGYKKHIAEQDARARRTDAQHKKYVEGVGTSFLSMQNGVQAFVVQMTDNLNEQLLQAKEDIDSNKKFLAEQDAGHKENLRELTESFNAQLAEQTMASELAAVHTRTQLTESFNAQLAEQTRASQLAEMHTRSELHLASQELLGFKQGMCLPLAGSECLDIWDERDDAAGCTLETVESINAFLEPYEDAVDDEITRVLAAAACGHKRAIGNACDGGLCAFELQAMVYPSAGAEPFTSKAGKALAGQQAGAQARSRPAAWSPPPRELCSVMF